MALTVNIQNRAVEGSTRVTYADVDFDSSYAIGGESLTAGDLGLNQVDTLQVHGYEGLGRNIVYDHSNNTLKVLQYPEPGSDLQITDDDSAASNGTALKLVGDADGSSAKDNRIAHFRSTTASNSDADFQLSDSQAITVKDDDSPGGVAVYATDASGQLQANTSTGEDVYVATSNGTYIRVAHDNSPSSSASQVYFDDNAGNADERFLATTNGNANQSYTPDAEVRSGEDLSNLTNIKIRAVDHQ